MSEQNPEKSYIEELWEPVLSFEDGQMNDEDTRVWFANMVETGYIWKLPDNYVDYAAKLINYGYIGQPTRELHS